MQNRTAIIVGFLLVFSIFFSGGLTPTAAAGQQSPDFQLPVVKKDTLLNGLQLLTLEKPGSSTVSVRIRVNSGAVFDLAGKGGLADLTAGMLLRGGGGLTASNVVDTVDQLDINIRINVTWDATDIEIIGPRDQLDTMFDLLGQLLITPTFDQKELDQLKTQRISDLRAEAAAGSEPLDRKAMETVFGSHPFGRPIRGTAESVQQITRNDLIYFHKKFYLANNAVLIAAGDIKAEDISRLARGKLGPMRKGDKVAPMFRAPEAQASRRIYLIEKSDAPTTYSLLAQVGPSRRAEDYFAALVMSEVLGSALTKNLSGIARLELGARIIDGPLSIRLQSPPAQTLSVIEKAIGEMTALQATPPPVGDVEAAKSVILSRFAEQVNGSPADVLLDMELYGLGKDYLVTYGARIRSLSPADIQQAAQKYLKPQSLSIVVFGPSKALENEIKKLGVVTVTP